MRAVEYSSHADLGPVASILGRHRAEIVDRWLAASCKQPFHQGEPDQHVADHIPRLIDSLAAVLGRAADREADADAPSDDPAVAHAAREHARSRAEEGLKAADIMTEFRLLRQEIWRAFRRHAPHHVSVDDFLAAELLVNDGLDSAIRISLDVHARELEASRAEVERTRAETERQKEDLLAAVAHDLKTPITSARGYLQLLDRWGAGKDD